jgi:thiol:disulfide interchange protein DsbD
METSSWIETFNQLVSDKVMAGSMLAYVLVFAAGIFTSFTPCVYPVVPLTVGYIGAAAGKSKLQGFFLSISYVLGMAVVYTVFGLVLTLVLGKMMGTFFAGPWGKLIIAVMSLAFALAMFGLYEVKLPDSLASKLQLGGKVGGLLGAFLVGAVSGFVVGPCTAPVLGVILAMAAESGKPFYAGSLMFVFALGMGLLLIVVGTFAGLIMNLPRGGKWMIWVKYALGVVLLFVAGYYTVKAIGSF